MTETMHTYAELLGRIREAVREQHPEWMGPRGESALCDLYEARLAGLLDLLRRVPPNLRAKYRIFSNHS